MSETRQFSPEADVISQPNFYFVPPTGGERVPARIAHSPEVQPAVPELGEIETAALTAEAREAAAAVNQADSQVQTERREPTVEAGEVVAQLMYIGGLVELNRDDVLNRNDNVALGA